MSTFHETSFADYVLVDPTKRATFPWAPAPLPKTELGMYRILSPRAGVSVSPLCLGAMTLGNQWSGAMTEIKGIEGCYEYLDTFYEAGGNWIDTANSYQETQNEHVIGEWMEKRGNRDQIVLASKYTAVPTNRHNGQFPGIAINYAGNHKKSLALNIEASLKRLRTPYLDILYVHWWDHSTSIPELMQSLNDLVRTGKVLYLGISDTPAWIVAAANEYARAHALAEFVVYQGNWSLAMRDMERDVLPMCRAYGLALAPWGVMGGGKFKTAAQIKEAGSKLRLNMPPTEADIRASEALESVAAQLGGNVPITAVALAWVRAKAAYVFPIVGGSSVAQLKASIAALEIKLTAAQVAQLDAACPFHHGFPTGFFGRDPRYLPDGKPEGMWQASAGNMKFVEYPQASF